MIVSENTFLLVAEAYEVAVDILFPKAGIEFIDFGGFRVDEESRQAVTLKNRGKFDIGYRFVFLKEEYEAYFDISPASGTLSVNEKNTAVQIGITCPFEKNFVQESLVLCELYDITRDFVLGRLPMKISAQIVRSSHQIMPAKHLDFGKCCIGMKTTRNIAIENCGPYDLKYAFGRQIRPVSTVEGGTAGLQKKKPRTSPLNVPGDKLSKKEPVKSETQVFGSFTIHTPIGTVPANSKFVISVEFLADSEGKFTETLMLDCTDREVSDFYEDGIEYVFSGESQIPALRLDNFSKIFQTIDIIRDLNYWKGSYPVFSVSDNTLFLGAILLNSCLSVPLTISNVSDVNCDVNVSIKTKHKNDEQTFEIQPKNSTIGPQASNTFNLTFQSFDLENSYGWFEASVDNAKNDQKFRFEITAQSILPQIQILNPTIGNTLKFPRTSIGSQSATTFTIQNKSLVGCTLLIKHLEEDILYLKDTKPITLLEEEVRDIAIFFRPNVAGVYSKELNISSIENSFETFNLLLEAETSSNDLTFLENESEVSELNFGICVAGISKSLNICVQSDFEKDQKIIVMSSSEVYVFPNSFLMTANEKKEVQLTFRSNKISKDFKSNVRFVVQDVELVQAEKEIILPVSAKNGYVTYECSESSINFSSVAICEKKLSNITLKNTGKIRLDYEIKIYSDEGQLQTNNYPFSVNSKSGSVNENSETIIGFNFSSVVAGTFNNYSAVILTKNSDPNDMPLCIKLSGNATKKNHHISCLNMPSDIINGNVFEWVTFSCEEVSKRIVTFNNMAASGISYFITTSDTSGEIISESSEGIFEPGMNELIFKIKSTRYESKVSNN